MKYSQLVIVGCLAIAGAPLNVGHTETRNNVILFVTDGLRSQIVDASTAPTMARLRDEGVNFANSHSLFPTFTTANASAFATGHLLGDTGDFSNFIYVDFPVQAAAGSVTPFLEIDPVLQEVNQHFGGNYLHEESIASAARKQGIATALIGKLGPAAVFDVRALDGSGSLIVDDTTGHAGGVPLSQGWLDAIKAVGMKAEAPGRGENGNAGDNKKPGTWIANLAQQQYFLEVVLKVVLPRFKAANQPFVLVYWSRDPDGTQHNQGDSFGTLVPGINGPTSMSAIRATDGALAAIEQSLKSLGLAQSTNIVVAADHGFSTISKASKTSAAAKMVYGDVNPNELPAGFLAIDVAAALQKEDSQIKLFDPDASNVVVEWQSGQHPSKGNGVIGTDPAVPQVVIAANGGSDLIYLPVGLSRRQARSIGAKIVRALLQQDYVSGLFVDTTRLGELPGALALQDIGLHGSAVMPVPAVVVNFASFSTGCDKPVLCAAEVADTRLQQGQGMHGSFSRADTWNFMAARGPDFRKAYVNTMPASNADIGLTIAHILKLDLPPQGKLLGRVLLESLNEGREVTVTPRTVRSKPAANGLQTVLKQQRVGSNVYFDVAGFPGRTVGLDAE